MSFRSRRCLRVYNNNNISHVVTIITHYYYYHQNTIGREGINRIKRRRARHPFGRATLFATVRCNHNNNINSGSDDIASTTVNGGGRRSPGARGTGDGRWWIEAPRLRRPLCPSDGGYFARTCCKAWITRVAGRPYSGDWRFVPAGNNSHTRDTPVDGPTGTLTSSLPTRHLMVCTIKRIVIVRHHALSTPMSHCEMGSNTRRRGFGRSFSGAGVFSFWYVCNRIAFENFQRKFSGKTRPHPPPGPAPFRFRQKLTRRLP